VATTRLEKALSIPAQRIPTHFEHAVTLDKPSYVMPTPAGSAMARDASITLDDSDMQRFQLWIVARESGILTGTEAVNASPALLDAMADFEDYLNTSTYKNWASVDDISRDAQWRLFAIDVAEAVNAKATTPPSDDPFGQSSNPIAPSDVGELGGEAAPAPGETVTTGDPVTPDTVYGDDGSVVIVA
jgi:hypothetical protein